ncbi:hypothetical protein [Bacillus paramycoides]|uniref:hypothetical protein n=1 Tax=Bacillus paramycoides TaxID=2026194 RepID=UPI002E2504A9|nr:hypothetical protein [Bacillus paramycoides]MED1093529.1 hypothetical protein [Bacillus paramycoides]
MKKSTGIMGLTLIGILSIGSVTAFAQTSNNTVLKNTVMTEKAVEQDSYKENKLKEVALNAFQKNLNETIDTKNLYERNNEFYELAGRKVYTANWCDTNSEYVNGNKVISYDAVIDVETNKVVSLQYKPGVPKNQNYMNFPLDKAENLATNFVKTNNLFDGKSFEFLEAQSNEVNTSIGSKKTDVFCFYYKYDGGKTGLVQVNRDLKKVTGFILDIDADTTRG